jgi:hypothetical protein
MIELNIYLAVCIIISIIIMTIYDYKWFNDNFFKGKLTKFVYNNKAYYENHEAFGFVNFKSIHTYLFGYNNRDKYTLLLYYTMLTITILEILLLSYYIDLHNYVSNITVLKNELFKKKVLYSGYKNDIFWLHDNIIKYFKFKIIGFSFYLIVSIIRHGKTHINNLYDKVLLYTQGWLTYLFWLSFWRTFIVYIFSALLYFITSIIVSLLANL